MLKIKWCKMVLFLFVIVKIARDQRLIFVFNLETIDIQCKQKEKKVEIHRQIKKLCSNMMI